MSFLLIITEKCLEITYQPFIHSILYISILSLDLKTAEATFTLSKVY